MAPKLVSRVDGRKLKGREGFCSFWATIYAMAGVKIALTQDDLFQLYVRISE